MKIIQDKNEKKNPFNFHCGTKYVSNVNKNQNST